MAKHTVNILRYAITKKRVNQITGKKISIRCFEIELLIVSCHALRGLVPFLHFKKQGKYPRRSVNF